MAEVDRICTIRCVKVLTEFALIARVYWFGQYDIKESPVPIISLLNQVQLNQCWEWRERTSTLVVAMLYVLRYFLEK